jgi:hypothetical protein
MNEAVGSKYWLVNSKHAFRAEKGQIDKPLKTHSKFVYTPKYHMAIKLEMWYPTTM